LAARRGAGGLRISSFRQDANWDISQGSTSDTAAFTYANIDAQSLGYHSFIDFSFKMVKMPQNHGAFVVTLFRTADSVAPNECLTEWSSLNSRSRTLAANRPCSDKVFYRICYNRRPTGTDSAIALGCDESHQIPMGMWHSVSMDVHRALLVKYSMATSTATAGYSVQFSTYAAGFGSDREIEVWVDDVHASTKTDPFANCKKLRVESLATGSGAYALIEVGGVSAGTVGDGFNVAVVSPSDYSVVSFNVYTTPTDFSNAMVAVPDGNVVLVAMRSSVAACDSGNTCNTAIQSIGGTSVPPQGGSLAAIGRKGATRYTTPMRAEVRDAGGMLGVSSECDVMRAGPW
jgi:hypothetical protein